MVIGPVGLRARFELSLSEADGAQRGIRVPRLVVERTGHAPRASTTTNRAKRPESVRRGAVVRRTPGSEEACSSALRTVWNCGWSNRVESRFNSIPWHTHAVARRERRPRCTRSEIVAAPFGLCAPLELSRTDADGDRRGIRVPRLVVERTDHAPRASTTTNRAKRPESVRRGSCSVSNTRERRGMLVGAAHGLELWLLEPSGESIQFHPVAHTCSRTKGTSSALHAVRNCS